MHDVPEDCHFFLYHMLQPYAGTYTVASTRILKAWTRGEYLDRALREIGPNTIYICCVYTWSLLFADAVFFTGC